MAARLIYTINNHHEKQRVYRHFDPEYDENEFKCRYRFLKENVVYINSLIEPELCRPTLRSHAIPAETQILLALRYYATGSGMKVVGDTMGYHISSVSRAVRDVSAALCAIAGDFIKWPATQAEKDRVRQGFYDMEHFPGVIGAVDGTHIRIQSPPGPNEHVFVNRKGYHSINVQGVCDHNGKIINIVTKWPGSCHDSFIFRTSDLGHFLENHHRGFDVDGVLLGDSGYGCKKYLVTPYLHPVTESQTKFNKAHTKTRAVVERCFGWWKRRFRVLHEEMKIRPDRATKIILACAVLHNIALQRGEPMEDAIDQDQDGNNGHVVDNLIDGRRVRDFIADTYFN